ncbi:hypothetical protein NKH77_52780 [Streptomyces sp. M19]
MTVAIGLVGSWAWAPPAAADRDGLGGMKWGACPDDVTAKAPEVNVRCGTVTVPLDYDDPDGTRIDLMVSRLASENPRKRRGVLLLNPGGPGGSSLTMPADLVDLGIPSKVLDTYDLIGMDTRGFGHSAPIDCEFTVGQDYLGNVPPYAVDSAAVVKQAKIAKGSPSSARPMTPTGVWPTSRPPTWRGTWTGSEPRSARRRPVTSAFHGSALGAAYASMFPDTADRVLIDSNLGDTALDRAGLRRFARGMEETFPDFAKWAAARNSAYGLGGRRRKCARRTSRSPSSSTRSRSSASTGVSSGPSPSAVCTPSGRTAGRRSSGRVKDADGAAVKRLMAKAGTPAYRRPAPRRRRTPTRGRSSSR